MTMGARLWWRVVILCLISIAVGGVAALALPSDGDELSAGYGWEHFD